MRSILAGYAQYEAITGQPRPVRRGLILVGSSDLTSRSMTSTALGAAYVS